ncbi:MAG: class I SAM-dependent methyltransferase [Mesorhizobium sp.]|nr:MAG: class I SAM-dependent methyltransferase [Mesorhizobium sp.]TIS29375.1 MAG: class I SAM-dependent methyltransferase [Mesorhizobium sp.]
MPEAAMSWEDAVRWCMSEPSMKELARAAYFDDPVVAAQRYHQSAEFDAVRSMIPRKVGRALDLGAGNGILSYALAREGWSVTAVEPDPSALVGAAAIRALAESTGTPIDVVEAFGEAIPLSAAGYDLVVARQVLHHAHDLPAFCREMARLSREGATVLSLRDHVVSGPQQLEPFLRAHPLHHLYRGENAFTLAGYRAAIQGAGLTIDRELISFQSVVNYDPMTPSEIRERLAKIFGPFSPVVRLALSAVPFGAVARVAASLDRRPGRLVSFLCRKHGKD